MDVINRDICSRRVGRNRLRVGCVRGASVDAQTDRHTQVHAGRKPTLLKKGSLLANFFGIIIVLIDNLDTADR